MPTTEFTESLPDPADRPRDAGVAVTDSGTLLARQAHLLDIYAALGIEMNKGDPFTEIAKLRRGSAQPAQQLYDSIPLFGYELVTRERIRQITQERWSSAHDDEHTDHSLAVVAAMYAVAGIPSPTRVASIGYRVIDVTRPPEEDAWPSSWDREFDKRDQHDPLRRLVIAGALICAEIDRLQRAADSEERWERTRLRMDNDPRADL
jgi:hypothetical protein